ncbi:MAG: Flp pilus assembly complex ATPase component TadA [Candidatus Hydrogenedentes bacterium]|nr:Flp pilus assembly complex ATPase component TadA [Candidatus Hydrogenedentota bacterium]
MAEEQRQAGLGDALVKGEIITREDLDKAKAREQATGVPWHRSLLQMGKVTYAAIDQALRTEIRVPGMAAKSSDQSSLGDALVKIKAISKDQLDQALAEQKRSGRLLGEILMSRGLVTRRIINSALAKQYDLDFSELDETPSHQNALEAVPESYALKYQLIPISLDGNKLSVLISKPQVRASLGDLGRMLGKQIKPLMTNCDNVAAEIRARYAGTKNVLSGGRKAEPAEPALKQKSGDGKGTAKKGKKAAAKEAAPREEKQTVAPVTDIKEKRRFDEIAKEAEGAPVIKLVSTIIEGAINSGATDVHMDPQEPEMRVRYRIDGVLHDVMSISPEIEAAVVSRVKIMSDLDITETRRPQDGHIRIESKEREFDVRVATLPTYLGERVVLRLLDQSAVLSGIKDLGLESDDEKILARVINQPYGMILVTGPTGSGKTTTLYAALNQKNVLTDSIVTLEDPVEYQLSGINQVQIDPDIEVTFATTLRAALRQDIDVLLVGEIRDADTARIAIRAAMTGHLVFSTLHTNDAPEAISTLRNMQVPSYLIASALTAVVAQRLVRKICPDCREGFTPSKPLLKSLHLPETTKKLYRGKGCDSCYHTGNRGRTGIFEIIEVSEDIRRMIAADAPIEQITKAAKLKTMAERCRLKVKDGIVTPEEFLRVIRT